MKDNNIDATQNLIDSLDAYVKKFVFLSSIKIKDNNEYAKSKMAAERIIKRRAKEKNTLYDIKKRVGLWSWQEKQ